MDWPSSLDRLLLHHGKLTRLTCYTAVNSSGCNADLSVSLCMSCGALQCNSGNLAVPELSLALLLELLCLMGQASQPPLLT